VIENLLKNDAFLRYFPFVAGLVFVSLFVSLGLWQLDRAAEKRALLELFESGGGYEEPRDFESLELYDRIEVAGRYRPDRQILVENIPLDGRLGYYVITPFEPATNDPLLLVNRGWIPKADRPDQESDIDVATDFTTIRGLVGYLPRVAIRPGEAFAVRDGWPRLALYPTTEEVAAELDAAVLPITLLLGQDADHGFVRRWQPNVSGPMTHYSYAFQWFALALAVIGIAGWQLRKRWQGD
jgi:surfeit locus 1 family protein